MKTIKWVVIVLAFLGLVLIVFIITGYFPTKSTNTLVDLNGIVVVAQFVSALALALTVFYQVENNTVIANRQQEILNEQLENNNRIAKRQEDLLNKQIENNAFLAKQQRKLLNQQNNIAIFEKRYELYKKICEFENKLSIYNWIHKNFFANEKEYVIKVWKEDYTFFEYRIFFGYKIHHDVMEWYNLTTKFSCIMEQIQKVIEYVREKYSPNSCVERCLCEISQKRVDCKRILTKYENEIKMIDLSGMGTFKLDNIDISYNVYTLGELKCEIEHKRDEHYLDAVTDMQSQLEFLPRPKI